MQMIPSKNNGVQFWSVLLKGPIIVVLILCSIVAFVASSAVLGRLFVKETTYSVGFSEEKFSKIREGMLEEDVLKILDQPLRVSEYIGQRIYESNWTNEPSRVIGVEFRWWLYSLPAERSDSYEVRSVKFSPDGKVIKVLKRRYQD
jgi:hypothetical protein